MEAKPFRIAVCDDYGQERKSIVRYIENYYYGRAAPMTVMEFSKKQELMAEALQRSFDIVFVCFDGAEGIETAKEVRQLCGSCGLVIISDTASYGIEAHSLWANHYIIKPIKYDCICNALNRCERLLV